MDLRELCDEAYRIAKEHGWCDKQIEVPEMIALIHSEASEALEAYREPNTKFNTGDGDYKLMLYLGDNGKPEGIASEFADILIRVGHYCVLLGIDLDEAIRVKMKYNESRPYRHGGKRI